MRKAWKDIIIFYYLIYFLTMFEGTRLNYIVPGYTGHIPKSFFE